MSNRTLTSPYLDFELSRKAMGVTNNTIQFYKFTAKKFLEWLPESITPPEIKAHHVRAYLSELITKGKSDWTVNGNARAVRTLLRFWYSEKYIPEPVIFAMPRVERKRLPCLTAAQVTMVLGQCDVRAKALIMLMVDSGLRRSETVALNWGDLDMSNGLCRVVRGKGGKFRSVVLSPTTRRALLVYKRGLPVSTDLSPMIQTKSGKRFTGSGMLQLFRRLSAKTGVTFSPHALRRSFCILSVRAGMSPLHLQAMMGHASLDMVMYYCQMDDTDLIMAHNLYSPVENL